MRTVRKPAGWLALVVAVLLGITSLSVPAAHAGSTAPVISVSSFTTSSVFPQALDIQGSGFTPGSPVDVIVRGGAPYAPDPDYYSVTASQAWPAFCLDGICFDADPGGAIGLETRSYWCDRSLYVVALDRKTQLKSNEVTIPALCPG